ncbi:50S ribosomal protein L32 [Candidatus Peregrinibacteria bacterium]|nr:50S ribosomal protein L32 [Candidatus Peregrinibacteria bacterium]
MSKKPTPKKRASHAQTYRRYKTFARKTQKRLFNAASLSVCPKCREKRLSHAACPACGDYRGRSVINFSKKIDKITKVKA